MAEFDQVSDLDEISRIVADNNPRLVLGWREVPPRKRVIDAEWKAVKANLDKESIEDLKRPCRAAIGALAWPVDYHPHWYVDRRKKQYTRIQLDVSGRPEGTSDSNSNTPHLIEKLKYSNTLDLYRSKRPGEDTKFLFFAIAFGHPDEWVSFVRMMDPKQSLRKGQLQLVLRTPTTRLKVVENPDLVLDEDVDLIVTNDAMIVLNSYAYERLLSDVPVAVGEVERYLNEVEQQLGADLPFSSSAKDALKEVCQKHPEIADRLRQLSTRLEAIKANRRKLDAQSLERVMRKYRTQFSLLDAEGSLAFDEKHVIDFFEIVEGFWFVDDIGKEQRRALKFNKRED